MPPLIVAPCGLILCQWCADMGADPDDCGGNPDGPPAVYYTGDDNPACGTCGLV